MFCFLLATANGIIKVRVIVNIGMAVDIDFKQNWNLSFIGNSDSFRWRVWLLRRPV